MIAAALVVTSIALVLLAGAVELWWGATARQRQRASLGHLDSALPSRSQGEDTSGAAHNAPGKPDGLPWDALLQRAALPIGWQVPIVATALGLVVAWLTAHRIGSEWMALLSLALYSILVWLWLHRRAEKLQRQLLQQLPDFLDNMVRLSGIGNGLPMAFQQSTLQAIPPLRPLLDTALIYTRSGMDLDRALLQAARPYRVRTLDLLALVLGTSMRIGGRADQILQRMADFMRDQQQAQQELRSTTSETRGSAWVLGLLPPLCAMFMALINPDFFKPMFEQPLGHKLLLVALAMELFGAFLLYKLARSI